MTFWRTVVTVLPPTTLLFFPVFPVSLLLTNYTAIIVYFTVYSGVQICILLYNNGNTVIPDAVVTAAKTELRL